MIGIDLDGVLAEFCLRFTEVATALGFLERPYPTSEQKQWTWGFADEVWRAVGEIPNWWLTLPTLASQTDIEALRLVMTTQPVAFVTSRSDVRGFDVQKQSRLWLESIGLDPIPELVVVSKDKGRICRLLGIEAFLDDRFTNLVELADSGIEAVSRRWAYNAAWEGPSVGSVTEFLEGYAT